MTLKNKTNEIWQKKVKECLRDFDNIVSPRGMEVREVLSGSYVVPMPAYIDLESRKVNSKFMFAEAAWIISGSNRLDEITPYMKVYSRYSDDGVFLRGAYGPKVVDQLGYVVDSIEKDLDTRQAVINIWRERPGVTKDIPCTTNMQFLVRDGKLNMVTTMRSQDIVMGFTYDVFTFSMVAKAVQLLLKERGINVGLGNLYLNAGSMHIYDTHYDQAKTWIKSKKQDENISKLVLSLSTVPSYVKLIDKLRELANL